MVPARWRRLLHLVCPVRPATGLCKTHPPRAASHPRKNSSSLFATGTVRGRGSMPAQDEIRQAGPDAKTRHQGWEGHKEKRLRAGISGGTVALR